MLRVIISEIPSGLLIAFCALKRLKQRTCVVFTQSSTFREVTQWVLASLKIPTKCILIAVNYNIQ